LPTDRNGGASSRTVAARARANQGARPPRHRPRGRKCPDGPPETRARGPEGQHRQTTLATPSRPDHLAGTAGGLTPEIPGPYNVHVTPTKLANGPGQFSVYPRHRAEGGRPRRVRGQSPPLLRPEGANAPRPEAEQPHRRWQSFRQRGATAERNGRSVTRCGNLHRQKPPHPQHFKGCGKKGPMFMAGGTRGSRQPRREGHVLPGW